MRCFLHLRKTLSRGYEFVAAAVWIVSGGLALAGTFPPDPVDQLKYELRASREELRNRFPDLDRQLKGADPDKEREIFNKKRESLLRERIKALKTIPDMRRALLLNAWRLEEASNEMAVVDTTIRLDLVKQFETAVRKALSERSIATRLAGVNSIAEVGSTPRTPRDKSGMGHDLAADLASVIKNDPSPVVRAAAARALGQILPDPKLAGQVLGEALGSPEVAVRRGAAAGLAAMVRIITEIATSSEGALRVDLADVAAAGQAAVRAAERGFADTDADVRVLSADVFEQAASALANTVPRPSATEETGPRSFRGEFVQEAQVKLRPLMEALQAEAPTLARALSDPQTRVRLQAARAFEDIAQARDLLRRVAGGVAPQAPSPKPKGTTGKNGGTIRTTALQNGPAPAADDPLLGALKPGISALARAATDPSFEVRLKALDAIETIGPDASTATPALAKESRDPNLFVRWAVARALGKVGLDYPQIAVPALARLLQDQDFDVNIAAARALSRFGPAAAAALPDLIKALNASDAEKRKEVLRTLQSIGTDGTAAIPAIIERVSDPDPSVRQAAASLLGHFGPAASAAVPALRRALDDTDVDVRRAATDALLSIQP
jgi:HEAT repeat protein